MKRIICRCPSDVSNLAFTSESREPYTKRLAFATFENNILHFVVYIIYGNGFFQVILVNLQQQNNPATVADIIHCVSVLYCPVHQTTLQSNKKGARIIALRLMVPISSGITKLHGLVASRKPLQLCGTLIVSANHPLWTFRMTTRHRLKATNFDNFHSLTVVP